MGTFETGAGLRPARERATLAAMIEARELTKIYEGTRDGSVTAADHVSFRCEAGQVFGLLGPNGAGKTTTLRMLSTVLTPTSGTATVAGCDVTVDPAAVREKIGFLSGETGLYGRLTAGELVEYFGRLFGLDPALARRRVDTLFDRFDLREFRNVRCEKLSSGNKQKVNIARTLVHDPPVLILDEPTQALDVITARAIVEFIRECRAQGKCVLFSTHILSEAERLCDQIAIIHRGRIWATGTPEELKTRTGQRTLEDAFLKLVEEDAAA